MTKAFQLLPDFNTRAYSRQGEGGQEGSWPSSRSQESRSLVMAGIRVKDTKQEMILWKRQLQTERTWETRGES